MFLRKNKKPPISDLIPFLIGIASALIGGFTILVYLTDLSIGLIGFTE